MVKYRQATQKPSNVCFTGRGRTGETGGGNSHWVSVFAQNSHRGRIRHRRSNNLTICRIRLTGAKSSCENHYWAPPPFTSVQRKKSFLSSRHETLSPVCLFLRSADQFINQEEEKVNWFRSLCRPEPASGCFVFLGFQIFSRLSGAAKSHRAWINKSHFWDSKS